MSDAFGDYLRTIGRVPLLTAQEEVHLGTIVKEWMDDPNPPKALERRGRRALKRIVNANLRLVVTVALRYIRRLKHLAHDPMDLVQATAYVESIGKAAFPRFSTDDWRQMAVRTFRPRSDGLLELDYDPAVIRTTRPWLLWLLRPLLWRAVRGLTARVPVLVVRGALSDILPADVARQMAATSESARLVEVPDVGHAPMLSEPEARDAILTLLERVA